MSNIFNSLKGLVTPELISKAASFLGEDSSKVQSAVGSIIPSLLGSLLAKGNDANLESALVKAGKESEGLLSGAANLFSGGADEKSSYIGSRFLDSLLGDKLGGLTSLISSVSGISSASVGKLLSMVSPLIAGFLGNKITAGGFNLSKLLGALNSEKGSFLELIPSGLTSVLGIPSLASLGSSLSSGISSVGNTAGEVVAEAKKGSSGLIKWLLLIAALIVLFFIWRSCQQTAEEEAATTAAKVDSLTNNTAVSVQRVITEFTLPNGEVLKGYEGGIEDQLILFIGSNDYKLATPEALKEKWFNFDNIEFKHGSAIELTEESYPQIMNVVAILSQFKDAKVKVGGYTDKSGNADANMKLSQERAGTIKGLLEKNGIDSKRISAEGYGDQFATHPADAPDSLRALDRKIALRLEK